MTSRFRKKLKFLSRFDCIRTKPFMIRIELITSRSVSVNSRSILLQYIYIYKVNYSDIKQNFKYSIYGLVILLSMSGCNMIRSLLSTSQSSKFFKSFTDISLFLLSIFDMVQAKKLLKYYKTE
jgi:hypothetical protein